MVGEIDPNSNADSQRRGMRAEFLGCKMVGNSEVGALTLTQAIQIRPASTGNDTVEQMFRPPSLALFK
jgi:hypothetical protein